MTKAVILGARRTPQGKMMGSLASLSAVQLGVIASKAALEDSKIKTSDVEYCLFGNVLQAGLGQNPARQVAIGSGLDWDTVSITTNKLCLSGSTSIIDAARLIVGGEAEVVLAGGMESMTNAPHLLMNSRKGHMYGDVKMLDHMAEDGLSDAFDRISMGSSTQQYTDRHKELTRQAQDEYAALSHQRAAQAIANGVFSKELAPVEIIDRKGNASIVDVDEGVRADTTVDSLGKLRPAFSKDGTITAGNASQISDGAAAVVVSSEDYANKNGHEILATIEGYATVAGPDNSLLSQPANALEKALRRANWSTSELKMIEINEAFASVALKSMNQLGVSESMVNLHGGAISLGHPIGASGTRLSVHVIHQMVAGDKAAIGLCGGGGQGDAILFSR